MSNLICGFDDSKNKIDTLRWRRAYAENLNPSILGSALYFFTDLNLLNDSETVVFMALDIYSPNIMVATGTYLTVAGTMAIRNAMPTFVASNGNRMVTNLTQDSDYLIMANVSFTASTTGTVITVEFLRLNSSYKMTSLNPELLNISNTTKFSLNINYATIAYN